VLLDADGVVRARSRYIATLIDGTVHAGDYFDVLEHTPRGRRIRYRISIPRNPDLAGVTLTEEFTAAWRPTADNVPAFARD